MYGWYDYYHHTILVATTRAPYHSSQATAAHKDVGLQEIAYTGTRSPWETSTETKTSSPAAPKVVILTTPDVASDENLAKTPPLQRGSIWPRNSHQVTGPLDDDMSFIWISIFNTDRLHTVLHSTYKFEQWLFGYKLLRAFSWMEIF